MSVLLAAVGVSLVRLALPTIGEYRHEAEGWLGRYLGQPVTIKQIAADWKGWTPQLRLHGIALLDRAGGGQLVGLDAARIDIDPLGSLWHRRLVQRRLTLSGVRLAVTRLADGTLAIGGVHGGGPLNGRDDLATWLFRQHNIVIENAKIIWREAQHQQPIRLSEVTLKLRTDGQRMQLDGHCRLPGEYGESLRLAVDGLGVPLSADWTGDVYLEANGVRADSWYGKRQPAGLHIAGGRADVKVWSRWQGARPQQLEGQLGYTNFTVRSGKQLLHIDRLAARFNGKHDDDAGWHAQLMLDQLLTENGSWPRSRIELAATGAHDTDWRLAFSYLKLDDLAPFLAQLPARISAQSQRLPAPARAAWLAAGISGELRDGAVSYQRGPATDDVADDVLSYALAFTRLRTRFTNGRPNINGLNGRLNGRLASGDHQLTAQLQNGNLRLTFPDEPQAGTLQPDILLTKLNGELRAQHTGGPNGQWRAQTRGLILGNAEHIITLYADLGNDTHNGQPEWHLFAEVQSSRIDKLHELVPASEQFRLKQWLAMAIQGGTLDSAQFAFRGNPALFPFRGDEGRLQGLINVSDLILAYSKHWPEAAELTAQVLLDNQRLTSTVVSGKLLDADILQGGVVRILDLTQRPKRVALAGRLSASVADLRGFINASPLRQHKLLAPAANSITGGDITLDMDMLMAVKSKTIKPQIDGTIHFANASLRTPGEQGQPLRIDKISGPVRFTRATLRAEALSAELDGQPVTLAITGPSKGPSKGTGKAHGKGYETMLGALVIAGSSDQDFITAQLRQRLPQLGRLADVLNTHLKGQLAWQAAVHYIRHDDEIRRELRLASDLNGMAVDLPPPLGKAARERRPLALSKPLYDAGNTELRYGDILHAAFIHPPGDGLMADESRANKLQQVLISVGSGPINPEQAALDRHFGLRIRGAIDQLNFKDWLDTVRQFAPRQGEQAGLIASNDIALDLAIDTLDLYGQRFADLYIKAQRRQGAWRIKPAAAAVDGLITIPADFSDSGRIRADLARLALTRAGLGPARIVDAGDADNDLIEPGDDSGGPPALPALALQVDDFTLHGMPLGRLELRSRPTAKGLRIEKIRIKKPGLDITAQGDWVNADAASHSRFSVQLRADEMGAMLETFGYDGSPLRGAETDMTLEAEWPGPPLDFALQQLNGQLDLRLGKGQIVDVEPAAGRLFGLLSLQTLPRRLSLDFSDLLGKGLAFDRIEGNFNISAGNAYTNDLLLSGPAAQLAISGRTGLAQQDYDQLVTVTPQVADTLFGAGALLGPLGLGVGAALYLAGNMFKPINEGIDNMLRYQYSITGPWEAPMIERLNIRSEGQAGQARLSRLPAAVAAPY